MIEKTTKSKKKYKIGGGSMIPPERIKEIENDIARSFYPNAHLRKAFNELLTERKQLVAIAEWVGKMPELHEEAIHYAIEAHHAWQASKGDE